MVTGIINNNLIIGLGGTGGQVLKELRKRIYDEHGEIPVGIGFMLVDSTRELMRHDDPTWLALDGHDARFSESEFLDISLKCQLDSLATLTKCFPNLKGIIENCERLRNYQPETGAMRDRRLGRILLGIHATEFDNLLTKSAYHLQKQTQYSNLSVTIVTGLSGGTGSGCVISIIALILRLYPDANITVMATLPTIPSSPLHETGRYLANAYAALRELNALNIGKLKLTDLVTGEKFQPELPYDRSLDFCHKLQENKLFRLFLFDSSHSEYDMMANILYHNIWLGTGNSAVETYRRNLEMYATIPAPEFDASAKKGECVEARTRAVGAIRLCRIVYPRKQILHYLAQSATSQAIWQMLYNNYDGGGYIEKVAEFEPREICRHNIEKWHLDYESLTLQYPIVDEDYRYVRRFYDEWSSKMERYGNYKEVKDFAINTRTAFHVLADYAKGAYFGSFRSHEGVVDYFADKICIVRDFRKYAKEMNSIIEKWTFSMWLTGEYGLCQLCEIYDALIEELQEETKAYIEQRAEKLRQCVVDTEKTIDMMLEEVSQFSRFQIRLKELTGEIQKKYLQFRENMVSYYSARTELVSLDFAKELLRALLQELDSTKNSLYSVVDIMKRMNENAQRKANNLLTSSNHSDSKNGFIDLSNCQDIGNYKKFMFADKDFIQKLALQVRTSFADNTKQSFSLLSMECKCCSTVYHVQPCLIESIDAYDKNNSIAVHIQDCIHRLSPDFSTYIDSGKTPAKYIEDRYFAEHRNTIFSRTRLLEEAVKVSHELVNVPYILHINDPYIQQTNVLHELEMRFPTEDSLASFIKQVLSAACDSIQLDDYETKRVVRNNPLPNDPWLRPHEIILVRIPHATNEREELASERLKALITANCGFTHIEIDTDAPEDQEICIAFIRTNFPIRFIACLPDLKRQYDQLMTEERLHAMHMLHTEDAFTDLPSLEVEEQIELYPLEKENVLSVSENFNRDQLLFEITLSYAICFFESIKKRSGRAYGNLLCDTHTDHRHLSLESYLNGAECNMTGIISSTHFDQSKANRNYLAELEEEMDRWYDKDIYGVGIESFYNKEKGNIANYVKSAVSVIANNAFYDWFDGTGISNLKEEYKKLIEHFKELSEEAEEIKIQNLQIVMENQSQLANNRDKYLYLDATEKSAMAKTLYNEHRNILIKLYEAKQKVVATGYEQRVIERLCVAINSGIFVFSNIIKRIDDIQSYLQNKQDPSYTNKDFEKIKEDLCTNDSYLEWILDDFRSSMNFHSFDDIQNWLNEESVDKWITEYLYPEISSYINKQQSKI